MSMFIALTLCSVLVVTTDCISSSNFDQRQTGEFNVQIGLKNIKLIALLKGGKEEYVDYDYAYDYSDMTIKPPHGSTLKPLNVTNIAITTESQSIVNSSTTPISTTVLLEQTTEAEVKTSTNIPVQPDVNLNQATTTNSVDIATKITEETTTTILVDSLNTTSVALQAAIKCRRGFAQNKEGKCEYKGHGTTNALRRIVNLAQKIKISRDVKEP
ncbi:uncharacterized protein LOC113506185 [Trichoplusia ni]|uniref:Uncharacterized protein LOC113506185 n=1 Tax=Trichoplusia ni TaxID=7111 RepID=A0A7E5WXE6_TRINI|nr:uncharacterized protein LOC113506185 [Trichoplusia ni]